MIPDLIDQGQFVTDGLRSDEGSTGLYWAAALPLVCGIRQLTEPQLPGQIPGAGKWPRQKEPLVTKNRRVWEIEQDE